MAQPYERIFKALNKHNALHIQHEIDTAVHQ
jgi:hypothetical protein